MKITRSALLALALSVLGIGLVIVLGVRLDQYAQEEIVTRFSQRQLLLVEQAATGIQSIFDEARRDLLHISGASGPDCLANALRAGDEEKIAACREIVEQGISSYLDTHPSYTQIRYIDATGQEIGGAYRGDSGTARAIPQDQLRSQAERDFFVAAMQLEAGQLYVSPLEPAQGHDGVSSGTLVVRLAMPIFDSQGQRAGILVLNLLSDGIRALISHLSTEEEIDAWVLDETGVEIINVTRPEWEGSDAYEYCQQTGDEPLIALAKDMLAGGQGVGIYFWPEGEGDSMVKKLIAYAPVYPAEGRLWSVSSSAPYDYVLTEHRQTRQTLLFLGAGITVTILAGTALVIQSSYRQTSAEQQTRRGEELESLQEISLAITAQLELDELLQDVLEQGCRLLAAGAGGIYLVDRTRGDLELIVSHGYARDYAGARIAPSEGLAGKVLQSGEPLAVDDYSNWEGRSQDWKTEPLTAVLGVPLERGEQIIGVLEFAKSAQAASFNEHDLWLATLFASQAATAIENARLLKNIRIHAEELGVLNELGQALTTCLDVEQVLAQAYQGASRLMDTANFYIVLYHPDREEITFALNVIDGQIQEPYVTRPVSQGLAEYVIHSQAPLLIEENLPRRLEELGIEMLGRPAVSWVGAPLVVGDQALGMMAAVQGDEASPAYGEHERDLLLAIANQTAIALQNAYLFQETQRRATQAALIYEMGQRASSKLELDTLLSEIATGVCDTFGYYSAMLLLLDETNERLALQAIAGGYSTVFHSDLQIAIGEGMIGYAAAVSETQISGNVSQDPHYVRKANEDTKSEMAVPIRSGNKVIGVLDIQSNQFDAFDESDVMAMETLADQISVAIENARLYEAIERELVERKQAEKALARHNRELALLNRASQAFSSTLDLDQVLATVLEEARRLLGVTACSVWLTDSETNEVVCQHSIGSHSEMVRGWRLPLGEGFAGLVARDGEVLIVPDAQADNRYFSGVDRQTGLVLRSILNVPLRAEEQVVGVLQVLDTKVDSFDAADVALMEPLAAAASIAIENARLHQQVLDHTELLEQRVQERTAQLQTQYARLEAILNSASDGIIVIGTQGELILANPVAQAWLNQTLSPEDANRLRETVQDLAQRAIEQPEVVLELTGIDLELKASLAVENESKQHVVVVAAHDVSHLKALDRAKTRFVSNVSHELRTPVTTIKLYAHLMRQKPEKWEEYLGTLLLEADRQARLVEDILQISHVDTGRLEINPQPALLNELTDMLIANRCTLAESEGLVLEHHPAEPGPTTLVDRKRMTQVLNNLVENAIHYTPEGGKIAVSTGTREADGRTWATVTVTDTGMGISEEELPHIFERFFRGAEPQSMQISGSGLGLAIAKEIVDLHGGRITVESKVGAGSAFTIWLPLADRVS